MCNWQTVRPNWAAFLKTGFAIKWSGVLVICQMVPLGFVFVRVCVRRSLANQRPFDLHQSERRLRIFLHLDRTVLFSKNKHPYNGISCWPYLILTTKTDTRPPTSPLQSSLKTDTYPPIHTHAQWYTHNQLHSNGNYIPHTHPHTSNRVIPVDSTTTPDHFIANPAGRKTFQGSRNVDQWHILPRTLCCWLLSNWIYIPTNCFVIPKVNCNDRRTLKRGIMFQRSAARGYTERWNKDVISRQTRTQLKLLFASS